MAEQLEFEYTAVVAQVTPNILMARMLEGLDKKFKGLKIHVEQMAGGDGWVRDEIVIHKGDTKSRLAVVVFDQALSVDEGDPADVDWDGL